MSASLLPLHDFISPFIEHNPFSRAFHRDTGSTSKAQDAASAPVLGKTDSRAETMSYYKQTDLSLSLSATYTRTGALQGANLNVNKSDQLMPLGIDLSRLKNVLDDLTYALKRGDDSGNIAEKDIDPDDFLKKLILEKLFGKSIGSPVHMADEVRYYQKNASRIDFNIDFSGIVKWKGSILRTEFHMELHLQQKRISYIDYKTSPEGLTRLDDRNIDTGRYIVSFENSTSLTIFDKFSQLSTTIWGDPHVDLSDQEGRCNGEFSDLKKSTIVTSLKLLDNTTVVIKAPDHGLIQEVHVFKDSDHIKGTGRGAFIKKMHTAHRNYHHGSTHGNRAKAYRPQYNEGTFGKIDHVSCLLENFLSSSDVVTAGGDGNDWFDEEGNLVWGDGPQPND